MNVNQEDFPAELEERATSILLETGRITPRADLLAAVLGELETAIAGASTDDEILRRDYLKRMMSFEERIRLRFAHIGSEVTGIVRGLDRSGGLILETDAGRRVFHAGEVTRAAQLEG
jgi:BirA family biotin operon repressor/biotin-[acetyl-CoA-carboxylase] ligase